MSHQIYLFRSPTSGSLHIGQVPSDVTPEQMQQSLPLLSKWLRTSVSFGFYADKVAKVFPNIQPGEFQLFLQTETHTLEVVAVLKPGQCEGC